MDELIKRLRSVCEQIYQPGWAEAIEEATNEIEHLRTEKDKLKVGFNALFERSKQIASERDEFQKDAEKYRYMRNALYRGDIVVGEAFIIMRVTGACPSVEEFDAAITARMEKENG